MTKTITATVSFPVPDDDAPSGGWWNQQKKITPALVKSNVKAVLENEHAGCAAYHTVTVSDVKIEE